jgi:ubiquinone/menaquinone biosynthesis C-methylase UbiE
MKFEINNKFEKLYKQKKLHAKNGWQDRNNDLQIINWVKILLEKIGANSGKLLELGCGAGNISIELAKQGFNVTGIDISLTAINWAEQRFKRKKIDGEFHLNAVSDLSIFNNETFDIVLDSLCMHYLIYNNRPKAITEAYRVLKNDGYLLIMTMCNDPQSTYLKKHFEFNTRYLIFNGEKECYLGTPEILTEELTSQNFIIAHSFIITGNPKTGDQDMFFAVCKKKKQL